MFQHDFDVGMVVAEKAPENHQRVLVRHPGVGQVTQVLQHKAEVVKPDGHVRVLGIEGLLVDAQRALGCRPGTGQVS